MQRLIDDALVKVNGRVIKASYHPRDGDRIEMVAPPEPVNELVPEPIPLDVVYEDEYFMAINKQANLMVHPARGTWTGTLVNGLVYYGSQWSTGSESWRPGILHRLDRNTTGIMLVAKTDEAHWRLARQFEDRTIKKTYLAIIQGWPPLLADVIDMPIGRDRYVREKQAVRKVANGGRPAVTGYQVLAKSTWPAGPLSPSPGTPGEGRGEGLPPLGPGAPGSPCTYAAMKLTPRTGRTHQLRVHMSSRGWPIVGDTMYGGRVFEAEGFRMERQALHAREITFQHPASREMMTLQAPLPQDMATLGQILGLWGPDRPPAELLESAGS